MSLTFQNQNKTILGKQGRSLKDWCLAMLNQLHPGDGMALRVLRDMLKVSATGCRDATVAVTVA